MTRPTFATINKSALLHNFSVISQLAPKSAVIAMVKADAYGHSLPIIVSLLDRAVAFGVACIEEALLIRNINKNVRVILMEGIFEASELSLVEQYKLDCVIHTEEQVKMLENAHLSKPITVWLKVNTGMQRLGVNLSEATSLWKRLANCKNVEKSPKLMTHFAEADAVDAGSLPLQCERFNTLYREISTECSLANSAAIMASPQTHADWVRAGIMLYGVSPFPGRSGIDLGLQAVMTIHSKIISIQDCQRGDKVGYAGTWLCPEAMRIGVVAIGYGDGYPFHAIEGTPVLLNGSVARIIGRISMDMLTIDLRQHPQAKIGDKVVLWGDGLPVEVIAKSANTIPWELLCAVSRRVHRKISNYSAHIE